MASTSRGTVVLDVRDVGVDVLGHSVLTSVSLQARAGEMLLLAGRNGAGKTTLLHTALGLVAPTTGEVTRAERRPGQPVSTGVGFDTPALDPRRTARQAIDLVAAYRGLPRAQPKSDPALRLLVDDILDVRCGRMSHGMRQRVSLAAALQGEPDLVVLDEPYNGLDPSSMAALSHLVRRAADRGAAVVVSSHYLAELAPVADHHVVLEAGEVVLDSDTIAADARLRHALTLSDTSNALTLLDARGFSVESSTSDGASLELWVTSRDELAEALHHLVAAGVSLYAVVPGRPAIEEMVAQLLAPDFEGATE